MMNHPQQTAGQISSQGLYPPYYNQPFPSYQPAPQFPHSSMYAYGGPEFGPAPGVGPPPIWPSYPPTAQWPGAGPGVHPPTD